MFSLFKKEVSNFLSSIVGYVVIIIFLALLGLFLWVFPGNFNVMESGYAQLESMFTLAPWVFMFLIPAVTMRSFAEEHRTGTIEFLLTKPLTEVQLIMAKYLAGLFLVILALIPTLVYYYSINQLATPIGNVDSGAFWGSYIGLALLSSGFVGIGLFASSITENQVVSFIVAVFLSFLFYTGFDALGSFDLLGSADNLIINLGINAHYQSLSRGVIDTRDVLYFASLTLFFVSLTRLVLESRKW